MAQLVFLHGPGAGACADAFQHQLRHFPGSLAPTLPGHLVGKPCPTVERYTEWVRGWLWAQGHRRDLVLVGYTLGACIALQYGLDYPDEVRGLVLIRGTDDPQQPPEYEREIHEAVAGSRYVKLEHAGHFPMAERPGDVNRLIEELIVSLS